MNKENKTPLPESVEDDNVQWNATDEEMDLLTISLKHSAEVNAQYAKYDTLVEELDNKIIEYVAEVERLRETLRKIADGYDCHEDYLRMIAKEALKEK